MSPKPHLLDKKSLSPCSIVQELDIEIILFKQQISSLCVDQLQIVHRVESFDIVRLFFGDPVGCDVGKEAIWNFCEFFGVSRKYEKVLFVGFNENFGFVRAPEEVVAEDWAESVWNFGSQVDFFGRDFELDKFVGRKVEEVFARLRDL